MEISDFRTLLETVVESGYFRFDNDIYRQRDGLAMGVKPAPPMAIIYVFCTVEMPILYDDFTYVPDAPPKPYGLMEVLSWDIYIDDTFSVGEGNETDVDHLFAYINELNPFLQFEHKACK